MARPPGARSALVALRAHASVGLGLGFLGFEGLGSGVLGFRVLGLGFWGFRVYGLGFGVGVGLWSFALHQGKKENHPR